jgi:hypothetical protein
MYLRSYYLWSIATATTLGFISGYFSRFSHAYVSTSGLVPHWQCRANFGMIPVTAFTHNNHHRYNSIRCWAESAPMSTSTSGSSSSLSSSSSYAEDNKQGTSASRAEQLRAEAERLRLEAELMDISLTLQKISQIEEKLSNRNAWLQKHPEEQKVLEEKLQSLQRKLRDSVDPTSTVSPRSTGMRSSSTGSSSSPDRNLNTTSISFSGTQYTKAPRPTLQEILKRYPELGDDSFRVEWSGFDEDIFVVYYPVAVEVERRLGNTTTLEERVEAFSTAPEIATFVQQHIHERIVEPFQDMKRLEELQQSFFKSTSTIEKEQIIRDIQSLERKMENDDIVSYTDSVFLNITTISDEEMQCRVSTIAKLPMILQVLPKRTLGIPFDSDVRVAIEINHYESQLQILDQVPNLMLEPDDDNNQIAQETRMALQSLPKSVRDHYARSKGLPNGDDLDALLRKIVKSDISLSALLPERKGDSKGSRKGLTGVRQVIFGSTEDLEILDRSRPLRELYPFVLRMEDFCPTEKEVQEFASTVVDRAAFSVERKPERVVGGYYVRGRALIYDDEDGHEVVKRIEKKYAKSDLRNKVRYFYIPDPYPITDEQLEMGEKSAPLLLVTGRNDQVMYNGANSFVKGIISLVGIISVTLTSVTVSSLPQMYDGIIDPVEIANAISSYMLAETAGLILLTQAMHELAHFALAQKHKVSISKSTTCFCTFPAYPSSNHSSIVSDRASYCYSISSNRFNWRHHSHQISATVARSII